MWPPRLRLCERYRIEDRHCEEPTGRANARPMTGSATKQSRFSLIDLLYGPGSLRFCARNDDGLQAALSLASAIRASLIRARATSSPRPAFASSSGCGDWWNFSCRRPPPPVRQASETLRWPPGRPLEYLDPDRPTTRTWIF